MGKWACLLACDNSFAYSKEKSWCSVAVIKIDSSCFIKAAKIWKFCLKFGDKDHSKITFEVKWEKETWAALKSAGC